MPDEPKSRDLEASYEVTDEEVEQLDPWDDGPPRLQSTAVMAARPAPPTVRR
jgi:hypothetical protein